MIDRNNRVNEELLDAELEVVCGGFNGNDGGGCRPVIVIDPRTHLPTLSPHPVGGPIN